MLLSTIIIVNQSDIIHANLIDKCKQKILRRQFEQIFCIFILNI